MRRILITGGAGFIGSHLADALLAEGQEVRVIDDLSTGSLANIASLRDRANFHFVQASIRDVAALERAVAGVDFIYHLAAAVGVELVVKSPVYTIEANVRGTEDVLAAAARHGVGVLVASTSEVYGKSDRECFREDDDLLIGPPTFGRWSYACSKLLDEFLALAYWREKQLPVVVVRLFNTVGPRQTGRYGMVVPRFVQAALKNAPITIHGDGNQSRCFCHVDDVVRALVGLPRQEKAVGQVFNIGSTEEVSILKLAQRVKELTGSRSELRLVPYDQAYAKGFEDMRRRVPSIAKIGTLLGWRPERDLAGILRSVLDYERIRSNG
ncbi:MAG: dTDP-glucose 4,6-dehydratase [Verrucomicrobiae bacterium]|nr:dTDP-glucose 4,6-dehydratase [Verrucomicrobiae bacterium]